jgi:acetyl-CoA synthetase
LVEYGRPDACAAELLCDRHAADALSFTFVDADLSAEVVTFGALADRSKRIAAGLAELGVGLGTRVATLMGKSADLVAAQLAIWRLGGVLVPLFTAFASPAIAMRLHASDARVVIVDEDQRSKLEPGTDIPVDASWRVVTRGESVPAGDVRFDALATHELMDGRAVRVGCDGALICIFTSGTTGYPKGVVVPLRAVGSMVAYLELGLDVRPGDVYWCAADPGWAYGLYYAVVAPLAMGRNAVMLCSGFSAGLTWEVLDRFAVTNLATAPTVYRALRNAPVPGGLSLRCLSSAGEPLDPATISWAEDTLGLPIRDHYGQTELGMVVLNSWHPDLAQTLRPGSMGRPAPGWAVAVLQPDRDEVASPGDAGRVAVDVEASAFFWFAGYAEDSTRTSERFTSDRAWYLTGDIATLDNDGHFFFSARDDDVIIMAGYRIGPFEVESAIAEHPLVAEVAVIGVPDPLRGEAIEAFVVITTDADVPEAFDDEIRYYVKTRFAAHAAPRKVHLVDSLPKTPSGKVKRFELREQRRAELEQRADQSSP